MTITTPWRAAYELAPDDIKIVVDDAYSSVVAVMGGGWLKASSTDDAENLVGHIYEYIWRSNPNLRHRLPCPDDLKTD